MRSLSNMTLISNLHHAYGSCNSVANGDTEKVHILNQPTNLDLKAAYTHTITKLELNLERTPKYFNTRTKKSEPRI